MPLAVTVFAPAKINLTLHVTGQRSDGYHLLDSLVVFADVGDMLALTPGGSMSMSVEGPFATGVPCDARNLVWRAAQVAGWTGHINLDKSLPHAAGIGGGSSDAAAMLRQSGAMIGPDAVLALGADVPVCVLGRAARMRGIGEDVTPVRLPNLFCVLVNPGAHVPTGTVFADLATRANPPMPKKIPEFKDARAVAAWLKSQRNDLEPPARRHAPAVIEVLADLNCTGNLLLARMSGSGATCFALYPTMKAAQFAAYEIAAAHPDWWCVACTLG